MIVIRDRRTGEPYRGRSPESIARRLYGRRAYVRYSADPNTPWQAHVCTPAPYGGGLVETVWYVDTAARNAAEEQS